MKLRVVVTGTGRCGTVYVARLLTELGLPCGHEAIFSYWGWQGALERLDGKVPLEMSICSSNDVRFGEPVEPWIASTKIQAEASYLAAPFLTDSVLANVPVIHLVRHPLEVLRSFVLDLRYFANRHPSRRNPFNHLGWEDRIFDALPMLAAYETPLERAAYYYVAWNELIERATDRPYLRHRIEDADERMAKFLALPLPPANWRRGPANSLRNSPLKLRLGDIPDGTVRRRLQAKMREYGYR